MTTAKKSEVVHRTADPPPPPPPPPPSPPHTHSKLDLRDCINVTGSVDALCELALMKSVDVSGCENLTGTLEVLVKLKLLRHLSLAHCWRLTGTIADLVGMKHLTFLDLTRCARVTGCVEMLSGVCGKIEVVRFPECWQLYGDLVLSVPRLTELREIDLLGTKRIKGFLSNFSNLEKLAVLKLPRMSGRLEDLAALVNLVDLRLSVAQVTGDLATALAKCTLLELLQMDQYDSAESSITGFAGFAKDHPECELLIRKPHSLAFKVAAKLVVEWGVGRSVL